MQGAFAAAISKEDGLPSMMMDYPVGPQETDRLRVLRGSGLLAKARSEVLDALCREAREHFEVPIAAVTLLDADEQLLAGRSGINANSTPRSVAFCNYTILADAVFVVSDAKDDARFADNALVTGPPFIRFYAGAPMIFRREIRLGAFCLLAPAPRSFTRGDIAELEQFADRAMTELVSLMFRLDRHA